MTAAISSERIGEMLLLCCYYLHFDNQTDLSEMGQTSKILLPTITVSAVTRRLKGEMIPFQILNPPTVSVSRPVLRESLVSGGNGSRFCANAHLRGDETVAKMGSTWPAAFFSASGQKVSRRSKKER